MDGPALAGALAASHHDLGERLLALDDAALRAPSRLPDWNRLTVVCHIRYGAAAIDRMVRATLAGEPALFYPGGRARQRPGTLVPADGESPTDVVRSFVANCDRLDATLASVSGEQWTLTSREPDGAFDLGPQTIYQLAVLRLTEVDVHAVDLDIGVEGWSDAFVRVALPLRLDRLTKRLANTPEASPDRAHGTWLLIATDGAAYVVISTPDGVLTRPAAAGESPDGEIVASTRDLVALMLGRPFEGDVRFSNAFAESFAHAFPGP